MKGSDLRPRRQWPARRAAATALLLPLLSACAAKPEMGNIGHVAGFAGAVAADEPRAVLVGTDILSSGGTAADAAVAMYFALSVTMPHAIGLGGGGACVVHSNTKKTTEALDFTSRPAASGQVGVPSAPRGLFALHAKYGRMRWEALLGPAESLARFGTQVSRAFAVELAAAAPAVSRNPDFLRIYANGNRTLVEGEKMIQPELAGLIGKLRNKGVGELYGGLLAREIEKAGRGALSLEDLKAVTPVWSEGARIRFGNETAQLPANSPAAPLLAKALDGALSGSAGGSPATAVPAVGFSVADKDGGMVACTASLGGTFGSGIFLREQGLLLAAPLTGPLSATPLVVVKHHVNESVLAATASGPDGARAVTEAARLTRLGKKTAEEAAQTLAGEKMNLLHCPEGLPPYPNSCEVAVDPKGSSFARIVAGKN